MAFSSLAQKLLPSRKSCFLSTDDGSTLNRMDFPSGIARVTIASPTEGCKNIRGLVGGGWHPPVSHSTVKQRCTLRHYRAHEVNKHTRNKNNKRKLNLKTTKQWQQRTNSIFTGIDRSGIMGWIKWAQCHPRLIFVVSFLV